MQKIKSSGVVAIQILSILVQTKKKSFRPKQKKDTRRDVFEYDTPPHGPPAIKLLRDLMNLMNKRKKVLRHVLSTRQILMHWASTMPDGPPLTKGVCYG